MPLDHYRRQGVLPLIKRCHHEARPYVIEPRKPFLLFLHIKGQIRYPLTFGEVLPYVLGGQLAAVLVILTVCLILMFRRKKVYEETRRDPAHIVALRKLDAFRGDRLWAPEKQKAFYSGVTDALREYIVARYGISAMEMTTKEIFDDLKGTDVPADLFAELRSLFERADYVKFAKYVATETENASAVPLAVRFVTATYQAEINADSPGPDPGPSATGPSSAAAPSSATGPSSAADPSSCPPDPSSCHPERSEGSAPAAAIEESQAANASDKKEN